MKFHFPVRRDTLRKDAVAGLVLGVESVPDGLAAGLLAGVNPLAGLYAYLFGTIGGSFFTQLGLHGRAGHRRHGHRRRRCPGGSLR
jgi:MFS superfamily sulfate permease-like transporter